jgi:hypothetical protein
VTGTNLKMTSLKPSAARNAKQQAFSFSAMALRSVIFFLVGTFLFGSKPVSAAPGNAQPLAVPPPVVALPMGVGAAPALPAVLTFQAWKSVRTDEARLILERMTLEGQIFAASGAAAADRAPGERQAVVRVAPGAANVAAPSPRSSPRAAVRPRQDNRVDQARMNLEIAQDLTINDYLQIYLSQFKSAEVLRDVARRMNPDEVAELLIAYQKTASIGEFANTDTSANARLCSGASR